MLKHKFSKILGVGLTLALLASMLVMAAPVSADSPADTDVGFEFGRGDTNDTAEWSTTMASATDAMGNYSVKLVEDGTSPGNDHVKLIPPSGITVSDLAALTNDWGFWYYMDASDWGPYLELKFEDPASTDYIDITIMRQGSDVIHNEWTEVVLATSTLGVQYYGSVGGSEVTYDGSTTFQAALIALEDEDASWSAVDWELTRVQVQLWEDNVARTCYVDDITIDGTTYELEPIFLDTDHPYFYTGGSTVTVTVPNATANADSVRAETVTVGVTSTTDGTGFQPDVTDGEGGIVLTETGPDTGVFVGLVPTTLAVPPGAGELVVADGDDITVTYGGASALQVDWGTGASADTTTISATVDDSVPTIGTITTTPTAVAGIVYNDAPVISADLADVVGSGVDPLSGVMTINGDVVEATFTDSSVTYTVAPALDPGTAVTVTIDVDDNMGNSAVTESLSFTIADEFNISVDSDPADIPATIATDVTVTFADVAGDGPDGTNGQANLLNTVKVTLSGPGVALASGDFDGTDGEGDATASSGTSLTFSVTPEQAGTITVTVEGTFDDTEADPVTKTLYIDVTGYVVEEEWADVGMETTGGISLRVTTKAGAAVNTGIVTITALEVDGFEKDVDDELGPEIFKTIVINGSTGEIKYDNANPEAFLVSDGVYEVTGITFANIGAVTIEVADAGETAMASFDTAFTVLGIDVYDLSFDLATLTAGVNAASLEITITDNSLDDAPVTDVTTITIGTTDYTEGTLAQVDNVYTVDPALVSAVATLNVLARNADNTRYGSADLGVALPTLTAVITEGTDVRDLMLVGATYDYTIAVTALDALGEPLALGQVWLGTYDADEETFTALVAVNPAAEMPLVLDEDGLGNLVIAQDDEALLTAGTLVWKVADIDAAEHTEAALLSTPTIIVQAPVYTLALIPEAPIVDEAITFTVTNNYGEPAGDVPVTIVTPGGDPIDKVTTPEGVFMYTPTEPGDYYVSVGVQGPDTVTVVVTRLASISSEPESVSLYVEETEQLAITAAYEDLSDDAVTADATYASDDDAVATVSVAGLITAVAEGEATITVSYTEGVITKTADVSVTVSEVPVLASIAASPLSVSLNLVDTQQLAITATYSDTSTAVVTADATYESDDESVATVDAGLITAVAEGTAIITVSYTEDAIPVTTDVSVTVTEVPLLTIQLYEGANPIYYTGATMDLPAALTNISARAEIIWQRDVSTGGAWWYYSVTLDYGEIAQLENDTVYIIVVSEDCIWELSQ